MLSVLWRELFGSHGAAPVSKLTASERVQRGLLGDGDIEMRIYQLRFRQCSEQGMRHDTRTEGSMHLPKACRELVQKRNMERTEREGASMMRMFEHFIVHLKDKPPYLSVVYASFENRNFNL